ncbi:MAG: FHA domain-containing protein [Muribaculaceae bacterium]|nr:FHA domain-containing protein [Muribaculaceae bacterium]
MSEQNSYNKLGQLSRVNIVAHAGQEVKFSCPACGCENPYRVLRAGNAIISCRECKSPLLLRIQSQQQNAEISQPAATPVNKSGLNPVPNPNPAPQKNPAAVQNASLLGLAVPTSDGSYIIHEHAVLGIPVRIKCGHCGKMHVLKPSSAGRKTISCVACSSPIIFNVDDPNSSIKVATAKVASEPQVTVALRGRDRQQSMGAISFGGFMGINRKAIRLRVGQNTIGRIDDEKPSSISFNDSFMSRQSVMIDVMPADDARAGYRFLFKVLNAANPVYVNKQQYAVGDSVYLNYGDTIKLGRTTVRFVRVK